MLLLSLFRGITATQGVGALLTRRKEPRAKPPSEHCLRQHPSPHRKPITPADTKDIYSKSCHLPLNQAPNEMLKHEGK